MYITPQKIPNTNLTFETNSFFIQIECNEPINWHFIFENEISVNVEGGLWRLLLNNKILYTSEDHKQQFGFSKPINLVEEIMKILSQHHLLRIEVKEGTGDLKLYLSNNYVLEIFITSSGYEFYSFSFNHKKYIGMGAGEISFFDIN